MKPKLTVAKGLRRRVLLACMVAVLLGVLGTIAAVALLVTRAAVRVAAEGLNGFLDTPAGDHCRRGAHAG